MVVQLPTYLHTYPTAIDGMVPEYERVQPSRKMRWPDVD